MGLVLWASLTFTLWAQPTKQLVFRAGPFDTSNCPAVTRATNLLFEWEARNYGVASNRVTNICCGGVVLYLFWSWGRENHWNDELPSLNQSEKAHCVFLFTFALIFSAIGTVRVFVIRRTSCFQFSFCVVYHCTLNFTVSNSITDLALAGLHSALRSTSTASFCSETPPSVVLREPYEDYTTTLVKKKRKTLLSISAISYFYHHRLINLFICLCCQLDWKSLTFSSPMVSSPSNFTCSLYHSSEIVPFRTMRFRWNEISFLHWMWCY